MNLTDLQITQSLKIGLFIFALSSCATNSSNDEEAGPRPPIEIIAGGDNTEIYEGEISEEAFRRAIRSRLSYIRDCYKNIVNQLDDTDKTKMAARIEIHKGGDARNVRIIENTQKNSAAAEKLGDCIVTVLSGTKFPSPTSRKAVQVVYPFEFIYNKPK